MSTKQRWQWDVTRATQCATISRHCAATSPSVAGERTHDSIAARLAAIDTELESADAMNELRLRQERRDLQAELASIGEKVDISTRWKRDS